jgi:N-acetylglucosamine-6-phosphate deacetylase
MGKKLTMLIHGLSYLDEKPVSVEIKGDMIHQIKRKKSLPHDDASEMYLGPGLIDHQVNGYFGHSFVDEELNLEKIRIITEKLWKSGVTTYFPTLITSPRQLLQRNLSILKDAMKDPYIRLSVPGIHLEGPYISPEDEYHGAHIKEWIRDPDWNEFMESYEASGHNIRQITLAPELKGALDFIKKCHKKNIVVGLGHHNGSAEVIKKAIDAGAGVATHLGNGIANYIHHHDNPIWPQLADDRLMASIIPDGFHLRPEEVQVFLKVKGPGRMILVSDVSKLGGLPPGKYDELLLTPEGMVYFPAQNVKAGASWLLPKGIEHMMKYTSCTLPEAVHMASRNPAKLFRMKDRGALEPGKRADLILFTFDSGCMKIHKTILGGKTVFTEKDTD